jgi:hypothetical protein
MRGKDNKKWWMKGDRNLFFQYNTLKYLKGGGGICNEKLKLPSKTESLNSCNIHKIAVDLMHRNRLELYD